MVNKIHSARKPEWFAKIGLFLIMANFTFKTFKLVLYKSYSFGFCGFMAFFADYANVFAFEFKPGFVVIKIIHTPIVETMTTGAIGNTIVGKLPIVGILVACGAGCRQAFKLAVFVCVIGFMTSPAVLFYVLSKQLESRL